MHWFKGGLSKNDLHAPPELTSSSGLLMTLGGGELFSGESDNSIAIALRLISLLAETLLTITC